ncbi:MAG: amino acid dehydrogenase [Rhodovulum sulfidophilum]|uniref:Amino acid dehydrogenase n=1 Tax=Rhodovulum sulfidophilum TaxID=35806 RepID=A0A2W5N933_RHOSU|nr:MAG: amino acid dehydrogenase [Rhodovulum sulfidophilum]
MRDVLVIGAGIVGVSVALHLRRRGLDVLLVDRGRPGHGTSFGNSGIIQREAVAPYAFPRAPMDLIAALARRGVDISYHPSALPATAGALLRYWWHSAPARHRAITAAYATLIAQSLAEHAPLVELAGAGDLVRKAGWLDAYRTPARLAGAAARAEANARAYGVLSEAIDGAELARREPHLMEPMAGAIHWSDTWTIRDPAALVEAYAAAFERLGGARATGEAAGLARRGAGWRLAIDGREEAAEAVVIAAGPWSDGITRGLGYRLPLFVKRGYHMHYGTDPDRPLGNWLADLETGYLLAPMRAGIRLTTGAELARQTAPATPRQLAGAEKVARRLFPLGPRLDPAPWLGSRPCTVDMLPVIGPAPRHDKLWFAFGHGHQGLTLGPATGRLLAELMTGEKPYVDPAPFAATRFRA